MQSIWDVLNHFHIPSTIHAILLIVVGYFLARVVSTSITKGTQKKISLHSSMLLHRAIFYLLFALFIISAFQQLGFHIGTLLGAAGILTAAIGFASQTSMSNVISGLFIIGEKPFEIGDTIRVNDVQGQVAGIDLLSVKIRTNDNTMIRVPNETLIKTAIVNLSYFPWRRADLKICISCNESIEHVRRVLLDVAEKNMLCLDEPAPSVLVDNIFESSVNLQFSVWANQGDFGAMTGSIQEDIHVAFREQNIQLAMPMRSIHFDETKEPIAIKVISDGISS